jgi:hypothetical protein
MGGGFGGASFGAPDSPNFAGNFAGAQANVGGMAGSMGSGGQGQDGTFNNFSGIDFSNVSVGPDMAAAMAAEAAAAQGMSAAGQAAAADAARAGYAGRNPGSFAGPTGLQDLMDAISRSSIARSIAGLFDKDKDEDFDMQTHMDYSNMMSMDVDPDQQMSMAQTMSMMSPQDVAAMNFSQKAIDAVNAYNDQRSGFFGNFASKVGKKGLNAVAAAKMAGAPTSMLSQLGVNAAMAAAPTSMIGSMIGAVRSDYSARNDVTEAMAAMAQANPEMSMDDIADHVSEVTGVDRGTVGNMQAGEFGGKPDAPGKETGDQDVSKTSSRDTTKETDGPENDFNMVPYNRSPLKGYLQSLYSTQGGGYMTDPYSSKGGSGAYGFRY